MRAAFASAFAILVAQTAAMAVDAADPISKYTIETPVWEVEGAPGQTEVLNGTVQEVYARALAINPNFQRVPAVARSSAQEPETAGLAEKRGSVVKCGNWPSAERRHIHAGIAYLRALTAAPRMPPGPGACYRVSCSYDSAIYWCNDNKTWKNLDNWGLIANSAGFIIFTCARQPSYVSGQNFEAGNWNTIVRGDKC